MTGTLFVAATPIGNLGDFSERARTVLASCDLIIAEDTRRMAILRACYGIETPVESYHKFSEKEKIERYLGFLAAGKRLALISDAGTPAVSDPGKFLVAAALDRGFHVSPLPGPSAAATAFSVSGMSADRFLFAGFLPATGAQRERDLEKLLAVGLPVVFYEAPTRIRDLLERLVVRCERIVVCRELTKKHEEVFLYRGGTVTERGEFTVVAAPHLAPLRTVPPPDEERDRILATLSAKDAVTLLIRLYPDISPNRLKSWFYRQRHTLQKA